MSMEKTSIGKWVLTGALIGALGVLVSGGGLPYDTLVQNISYLGGGALLAGLMGGIAAVMRNSIRRK